MFEQIAALTPPLTMSDEYAQALFERLLKSTHRDLTISILESLDDHATPTDDD